MSVYETETMKRVKANNDFYDAKVKEFLAKVDSFRKNTKKSDSNIRISKIRGSSYAYDDSASGFSVTLNWNRYTTKRLLFKNFDNRVDEVAKEFADRLDRDVGANRRDKLRSTLKYKKNNALAKTIDSNLESYHDSSGITGTINDVWFNYSGSQIRVSLHDDRADQLARDIAELIRTKYPKKGGN